MPPHAFRVSLILGLQLTNGELEWIDGAKYSYELNWVNKSAANYFILERVGTDYKLTHPEYGTKTQVSICKRGKNSHVSRFYLIPGFHNHHFGGMLQFRILCCLGLGSILCRIFTCLRKEARAA